MADKLTKPNTKIITIGNNPTIEHPVENAI